MVLGWLLPDTPAVQIAVVLAAAVVVWVGSGWLEQSAERVAKAYGLPDVIQGSVIVAVGSSFPELASVVVAGVLGAFDLGIGAVVGSAILNVLVIPGAAGLVTDGPVGSDRTIVYKEAQFYMIAVSALVVTFAFAVIYFPVQEGPPLHGQVTRPLALIPLLLYGLYLFIQWQDVEDHDPEPPPADLNVRRAWGGLVAGLLVILVAVDQLVVAVEGLSAAFGIPAFLAGVTIIAAATSLPDALVSVRTAQAGKGVTSLGNVLGSNTFDLLVAIPVGVLIAGSATVNFAAAVPLFGVLTVATILLFAVLRTDLSMTKREAYGLLAAYLVFLAWVIAETVGAANLIRGV